MYLDNSQQHVLGIFHAPRYEFKRVRLNTVYLFYSFKLGSTLVNWEADIQTKDRSCHLCLRPVL